MLETKKKLETCKKQWFLYSSKPCAIKAIDFINELLTVKEKNKFTLER